MPILVFIIFSCFVATLAWAVIRLQDDKHPPAW